MRKLYTGALFLKRTESQSVYYEISGSIASTSASLIKEGLVIVTGYATIGPMDKSTKRSKTKQLREQFLEYEYAKFVLDAYSVHGELSDRKRNIVAKAKHRAFKSL